MGNVQTRYPGPAADAAVVPGDGPNGKRYLLYVVSRGGKALADEIFAAMRRDMSSALVELVYDRRVGERRAQNGSVEHDRRRSDRRHVDASGQIAAKGWARIELE